jgi:hypothetical protein
MGLPSEKSINNEEALLMKGTYLGSHFRLEND